MASLIATRRLYVPLGIDLGGPEFGRRPPGTKWAAGAGEPLTYGDHVRARRLELGLYRREAADLLGVDETTVYNWESNRNAPSPEVVPRIEQFLGYRPSPLPLL
jgi:DNA-binding XRE family transcriptional regulator